MEREERDDRPTNVHKHDLPGFKGESFTIKLDRDCWSGTPGVSERVWEEIWREDPQMIIELLKYIGIKNEEKDRSDQRIEEDQVDRES